LDRVIERIEKGPDDRALFVASHVDKGIAYQIRAIRDRQGLSQEDLGEMVGMNQNAISRLESPVKGRPTVTTLKRLARALDVGLVVAFVPFGEMAKLVSGTPFVQEGLSTEYLSVPSFDEEHEENNEEETSPYQILSSVQHHSSTGVFNSAPLISLTNVAAFTLTEHHPAFGTNINNGFPFSYGVSVMKTQLDDRRSEFNA